MSVISRWKYFYPVVRFLGAVAVGLILHHFRMYYLEGALYDTRMRLSPPPAISQNITTVAVDSKTLQTLSGDPDTLDSQKLLEEIRNDQPTAVLYMSDPSKWVGPEKDKTLFAKTASQISNFFFTTEQIAPMNQYGHLRLPKPFDNLSVGSFPITRDNITFAGDKVTRRALISFEGQLLLQPIIANLFNHIANPHEYHGHFDLDGSTFSWIWFHPTGTYKPFSFIDVRDGRFPRGTFRNKIVLIGRDTQMDTDDYIQTPYSRDPLAMSRLEAQANIINSLIQNSGIVHTPKWLDLCLTILVAYSTVLLVWGAPPLMGIVLILGQALAYTLLAFFAFAAFGIWVNMIHPLLAIFASYYFFIPYRLIVENKKTWEYAQKNRLLTQVEELKTNFLSMMSHDLKTPIARIQGMAEMALVEKGKLSNQQKDALSTIMQSSEELGRFIGSILDLSRIESKEIKLKKTSRDINGVIKDVMNKYEFQAAGRKIKLVPNLEPLFSVRVDGDLISQVISNLVENAIKYSPDNSTVTISSREVEGKILVSVKDAGPGIAKDEVDNIFLKFYRSKAAKASPIKGSGLGLYLAKYFVELHEGQISVQSSPHQGSTFTVQLPLGS